MYRNKNLFCVFFSLFLIFIDQVSKYVIRLRGGFYICNENLAFGIKPLDFVYILIAIIIIFLIWISFKGLKIKKINFENFKFKNWSIILIVSGALSNVIDRLYFGCVIDFIDLKIWPVFNLADTFITIGIIIIIFHNFKPNKLKVKS